MSTLFRNSSPGALTREQALAREKQRAVEHRRQIRMAQELAAQGRGDDTEVAHLTRGELVVPKELQNPEVLAALTLAAAHNIPLEMLSIGNAQNRINPNTGAPEFGIFGGIGDWFSRNFGVGTANATEQSPSPSAGVVGVPTQEPIDGITVLGSLITDDPSTNQIIGGLHPSARYDATKFINDVKDQTGQQLRVPYGSGWRSSAEQDSLYTQNRTTPGQPVTNAPGGKSYHNYGLAFDIRGLNPDGKTLKDDIDFQGIAGIGKARGFEWGGNWTNIKDPPHFQRTYGYTTDQLRQMMGPDGKYPTIPGQRNKW